MRDAIGKFILAFFRSAAALRSAGRTDSADLRRNFKLARTACFALATKPEADGRSGRGRGIAAAFNAPIAS